MKENIADGILNRINTRVDSISKRLTTQYKGVKPFAQEPVPTKELLAQYMSLAPQDMQNLVTKYGRDAANEFVFQMENLRRRASK